MNQNKSLNIVIISILVLIFVGYLWYLTIPRNAPKSKVFVVPEDVLDNNETKNIEKSPVFGNIPVRANQDEKSRPDPFAAL